MIVGFFSKKKVVEIYAPIEGTVVDITQVPDVIFSQRMMGDGVAIEPTGNTLRAPWDGKVALVSETKHAIALSIDGLELLMHIGIDTVELNGRGFEVHVNVNDEVKKGDKLITFDREFIRENGKPLITPIVIINMDKVKKLEKHLHDASQKILTIEMK